MSIKSGTVSLRGVAASDLPLFFGHQRDRAASQMAAFTATDPGDREAFEAHWKRIMADPAIALWTIVYGGEVAGYLAAFERFGQPEVGYWIGRTFWGRGIATAALRLYLTAAPAHPLYARAAADNAASIRVLEKCGFVVCGHENAYANARGKKIPETIFVRA